MTDRSDETHLGTLAALEGGATLTEPETEYLFDTILTGRLTDEQIRALLIAIQRRGATVDELVGGARAMRAHLTGISTVGLPGPVIDTCGTGGAPKTFNVSTIAALVVAAALPGGVFVAKHGNRSRTGRGSAEILSALGVNVDAPPVVQERCLRECGVCFCFAIHHHPAAKYAGPARRAIGTPTIFNLLGPLTNPAGAPHQLLGVYDPECAARVAQALARLGSARSLVVHGHGGLDELSTTGPNRVWRVQGARVEADELDPAALGFARASLADLTADSLDEATALARAVLAGDAGCTQRRACGDMVVLSAGMALATAVDGLSAPEGVELARDAIARGGAQRVLEALAETSRTAG